MRYGARKARTKSLCLNWKTKIFLSEMLLWWDVKETSAQRIIPFWKRSPPYTAWSWRSIRSPPISAPSLYTTKTCSWTWLKESICPEKRFFPIWNWGSLPFPPGCTSCPWIREILTAVTVLWMISGITAVTCFTVFPQSITVNILLPSATGIN